MQSRAENTSILAVPSVLSIDECEKECLKRILCQQVTYDSSGKCILYKNVIDGSKNESSTISTRIVNKGERV